MAFFFVSILISLPPPFLQIYYSVIEARVIRIGYSMFCVGYGIYTRERSSRVKLTFWTAISSHQVMGMSLTKVWVMENIPC